MKIQKSFKLGALFLLGIFVASVFVFSAKSVLASVHCESQYGGGQTCTTTQLSVDKKVWDQGSNQYVDNLVASGVHHFVSGEIVTFTVRIQNVGSVTENNVMFSDTLPSFLQLVSGSTSENLGTLTPGQFVDRTITARVVPTNQLPTSPSTVCDSRTTNTAQAWNGDDQASDTSEVCVDNRVLGTTTPKPVKVIPSTGPEMLLYPILATIAGLGLIAKKKFN